MFTVSRILGMKHVVENLFDELQPYQRFATLEFVDEPYRSTIKIFKKSTPSKLDESIGKSEWNSHEKLLACNPKLVVRIERSEYFHCFRRSIGLSRSPMMSFGTPPTKCAFCALESIAHAKVCSISMEKWKFWLIINRVNIRWFNQWYSKKYKINRYWFHHYFLITNDFVQTLALCFSATNAAPHLDFGLSPFATGIWWL